MVRAVMKTMIIMLLCVPQATSQQLIQRVNYGILFELKGHLMFTTETWRHTFQITLPKAHDIAPMKLCNDSTETCNVFNALLNHMSTLRVQTIERTTATIDKVDQLIPVTKTSHTGRTTRSLLPFVADLSKSIFGTATEHDVQILAQHMNQLIRKMQLTDRAIRRHGQHISSYMHDVNDRLDKAMYAVKENHRAVNHLFDKMQKSISNSIDITYLATSVLSDQIGTAITYTTLLDDFLHGINDLINGKLSPYLVPSSSLDKVLTDIEQIIKSKHKSFQLVRTDHKFYYNFAEFLYDRDREFLYVTLKIPITNHFSPMDLYETISLPVPVNSSSKHATKLLDMPRFFGITNSKDYFDETKFAKCSKYDNIYQCNFHPTFHSAINPTCSLAIFRNDKSASKNLCNFRFLQNHLQPGIMQLSQHSVLVNNIPMLSLSCTDQQKMVQGCTFCIMHFPCDCAISTQHFYLPPQLSQCKINSSTITKVYPVNLALLQNFFNTTRLAAILPDTTFNTEIPIQTPFFKLYNHKMSEVIAADMPKHLSLRKMANAVKKDQVIFQSMVDPLLDGTITTAEAWSIVPQIITYTSFALATSAILILVYVLFRLRKLTLILMLLNVSPPANSHSVPSPLQYDNQNLITNSQSDVACVTTVQWPHSLLGIFSLSILLMIFVWYYKRYHQHHTTLSLEITTGSSCVSLPILHLPLCPPYWSITFPSNIHNIHVTGTLFPKLHVSWGDFHIDSKFNDKSIFIPCQLSISLIKAYQFKRILKQPFLAFIVIIHNGYSQITDLNPERHDQNNHLYPTIVVTTSQV